MKKRAAKPVPPAGPSRYGDLHCVGPELMDYIARDRAGEFMISQIVIGPRNSDYTLKVYYPEPQPPPTLTQADLDLI